MKILTVAFMLLFNYLDTLPKLYQIAMCTVAQDTVLSHIRFSLYSIIFS